VAKDEQWITVPEVYMLSPYVPPAGYSTACAAKMTPEERSESVRKAAKARWAKKRREEESS
jgi:hypothetical protein